MTETEALAYLKSLVAATTAPTLTDAEVTTIRDLNRLVDSDKRAPGDTDWEPTYDFLRAAAHGWELKAGKSSDHHQVTLRGNRATSAQQVFEHCMQMASYYRKKRLGTITIANSQPRQPIEL